MVDRQVDSIPLAYFDLTISRFILAFLGASDQQTLGTRLASRTFDLVGMTPLATGQRSTTTLTILGQGGVNRTHAMNFRAGPALPVSWRFGDPGVSSVFLVRRLGVFITGVG